MSDPQSTILLDRERVRRYGLVEFVKLAWHLVEPGRFEDNWHIDVICAHLEAVTRCEIRNLVINIPPGCMKSLLVSVFWPVWMWIEQPSTKWMYASFDASLSRRDALKAKEVLESEWFQDRWGDRVSLMPSGKRAEAASEYYTNQGGLRFSTSVGGKAVGWHSDIQVVDDANKPRDTKGGFEATGVKLQEAWDWWSGTMSTRQANPETFRRVVVQQRLHADDLAGRCLKGGEYVHLCLPMEYDPANRCETRWGYDCRSVEGELLWERRFSAEKVAALKDPITGLGAADYAAQCQQRPLPKGGGMFVAKHFAQRFRVVPNGCTWAMSWDMRFIDSHTRGDFVVGQIWAYKGANFYLVKQYRGRWSFSETLMKMEDACVAYPQATLKLIEDKANGPAIANVLKDKIPGIVLVNPEGGKIARANAVQPLFEGGNVWLPDDELGESWVSEYTEEMEAFPRGSFDDQVDATSQALSRFKASTWFTFLSAMDQAAAEGN